MKRDNALDILKGIGIITMVMAHCNMGESFNWYVGGFHMQLFFIVSGVLISPSKYSFSIFIKRRIKTLIYPYFTFAVVTLLYCGLETYCTKTNYYDFPDCLWGIIYSNRSIFPITGALWFLQCMFIVNIIFYFVSKLSNIGQLLVITLSLIFSLIQSYYDLWLPFSMDSALSCVIFMYIGFKLKAKKMNWAALRKNNFKLAFILITLTFVTIKLNGVVNPRICVYNNPVLYYANAVFATLGYYFLSKWLLSFFNWSKIVAVIGCDSIVFVGLNQLIITILYQAFNIIHDFDASYERALRNILICILTTILLYIITTKVTNSKFKILIGK